MWCGLLVVLAAWGLAEGTYEFVKLDISDPPLTIESPGYPSPAPNYDMEYSIRANNPDAELVINCTDISLSPSKPCGEASLKLKSMEASEEVCGEVKDFSWMAEGGKLTVSVKTGSGGGRLSCTVLARPNPLDAFLLFQSEEQESSEAGVGVPNKQTTCPCGTTNKNQQIISETRPGTDGKRRKWVDIFWRLWMEDTVQNIGGGNSTVEEDGEAEWIVLDEQGPQLDGIRVVPSENGRTPSGESRPLSASPMIMGRVVGGKETKANEYPFIVGIANQETMFLFCGASIITRRHALTAAHCTHRRTDKRRLVIIAGAHDLVLASVKYNRHGKVVKISDIVEHKEYDEKTMVNDIALLALAEELEYTNHIMPVCLPSLPVDLVGQYIRVLGWGKLSTGGHMSQTLQKVDLKVMPLAVCATRFAVVPLDKPKQVCTFGHGKDSCQGDSGGPLVWHDPETHRYTLVALVSYGRAQCAGEHPGLNTDVHAYMPWIRQKIEETYPGSRTCSKIN